MPSKRRTMTERLHLAARHRTLLEALLREHLPDVEVWAYGSRVNGRSHDGSDLDLVLRGPGLREIPAGQLGDLEEALRDSTIPFPVEARDWARLPERFHREIERGFVVLLVEGGRDGGEWCALGDIAEVTMGQSPPGSSVNDILFGKLRPYFHKVGIAPVGGMCSTDIVVLGAKMPEWLTFVLACVSSSRFATPRASGAPGRRLGPVAYTSQTSTGTKMPRTSWHTMSRYELCRPTDAIAAAFQQVVSPTLERIIGNIHESRTLAALRDTLLPKLISGEIRV